MGWMEKAEQKDTEEANQKKMMRVYIHVLLSNKEKFNLIYFENYNKN